jgi:integrase
MDITESDIDRFRQKRASGEINARGEKVATDKQPVRIGTVGSDIIFLKSATRWAWRKGFIPRDPLAAYTAPHEKNPRRPVQTDERIAAIRDVAEQVMMEIRWYGKRTPAPSYLLELVDLATHTGRRITAICELREEDLRLTETATAPYGAILWPAATDKQGFEMFVPLNPHARAAIDRAQARERPNGLLFPCPKSMDKPINKDLARTWHRKAEELAELPPMNGTCWHAYRRRWVTKRKDLPLPDIAAAGGWKDLRTVQENYMQPDDETKLRVVLWE